MVKPPKTMQPESVDLSKAGRGSGKAFQDDSFRNHMARKIDLQRKQFGLVVPPDPLAAMFHQKQIQLPVEDDDNDDDDDDDTNVTPMKTDLQPTSAIGPMSGRGFHDDSFRNYMARKIDMQRKQFGLVLPPDPRLEESEASQEAVEQPQHEREHSKPARRLAVRFAEDVKECSNETRKRKRRDGNDMASVLKRLKLKHGKRAARLRRLRRRQKSDSNSDEILLGIEDDSNTSDHSNSPGGQEKAEFSSESIPKSISSPKSSRRRRSHRPDLFFLGIVVMVNGYTNPDIETLQRSLQKHGGDLEKYETSRITHIIAEHLSAAKAKIYKKRKRPIPVCYPQWITDSVDAGRLLPHVNYLIQEVRDEHVVGTKTVKSFFGTPDKAVENALPLHDGEDMEEETVESELQIQHQRALQKSVQGMVQCHRSASGESKASNVERSTVLDIDDLQQVSRNNDICYALSVECDDDERLSSGKCFRQGSVESESKNSLNVDNFVEADSSKLENNERLQCGHHESDLLTQKEGSCQFEKSTHRQEPVIQEAADSIEGPALVTNEKYIKGRIRTVGTDPNFLESFFSNSRLSFIGSYKQRIQKPAPKNESGNRNRSKDDQRFVFHVDMDCFFASVVLRNYPEYRNKPVAISHNGKRGDDVDKQNVVSKNSTSECATCNYEARKFGITKGMYLGRAKELCPDLIVLYYDFEGYEEVSEQVADILHRQAAVYNGSVEQVSCDESYVEMFIPPNVVVNGSSSSSSSGCSAFDTAGAIAESLREEIFTETQCTASIGVGPNKLLAKLGTDKVKPNGSYVVRDNREMLQHLHLRDLYGVGYRMERRLCGEGLVYVSDVWDLGRQAEGILCRILGAGLGKRIFQFCRGEDDRPVKPADRKTIGAECNYGVRFDGPYGVDHMIAELAKEVERRMVAVGVRGSRVTLKVKQRKEGAKPPPKFLGHGSCHNLSKSSDTPSTREWKVFSRIVHLLFLEMKVPTDDVRGMGIVVSKLVFDDKHSVDTSSRGQGLTKWLVEEVTPHTLQSDFDDGEPDSVPVDDHNEQSTNDLTPPRRISVSFAPTTLLRSFAGDDVIEVEQELSPPAARAAVCQTPWLVEDSSSSDQSFPKVGTDSIVVHSPLVSRDKHCRALSSARDFGYSRRIIEERSDEVTRQGGGGSSDSPTVSQSQDCGDVILPPLSQIHMSQVDCLPSPLRTKIMEKIEVAKREMDVVNYVDSDKKEQARPACDDIGHPRLRQVSVKRMLKLAAVKSRAETLSDRLGDSVSLTQLECLPLEMQLQIANNDDLEVGVRSAIKSHRTTRKNTSAHLREEKGGGVFESEDRDIVVMDEEDVEKDENEVVVARNNFEIVPTEENNIMGSDDARAFYRDNIVPLQKYLNENSEATEESLQQVINFLCLCITEQRPRDTVLLLRSIKNRSDVAWSQICYSTILEAVNERCVQILGCPLDVNWLGL